MFGWKKDKGAAARPAGMDEQTWQRETLSRLAFSSLQEQRRARRWGIFFKLLLFAYLFALLFLYQPSEWSGTGIRPSTYTALVKLNGVIAEETKANADSVIEGLQDAFEDDKAKGVILRINSPGGSPVQAAYIYDEIKRLRKKYPDKKIYAVVEDMAASGGYYVASAADEIYVNESSIVGSIGVRMDSFGFVEALDKLGIERRLLTAGEHKGLLDPFLPLREDEVAHVRRLLDDIHEKFIKAVKSGRGERLQDDPKLFSGLMWTGSEGIELGLADGLGDSGYVARELVGAEDIVDFTKKPDLVERFSERLGVAMARAVSEGFGQRVR